MLVIGNSEPDSLQLTEQLRHAGYLPECRLIASADEFREALAGKWDAIVSEYVLPDFGALDALRILNEKNSDLPFIVISDEVDDRDLHAALAAGAGDFVARHDGGRLAGALSRETRAAAARRERKHLEEQFRHAQRLEAVGRLAGGVAHDFNNLLTIISGYAELLLVGDGVDPAQRGAVEEIRRAALRGGALTHRLLAFSRRQPMEPQTLHINELLLNIEKMVRPLIGEDIELATIAAAAHDTVRADPGQLEQVLLNLVVNARDAMPQGGHLTVESADDYVSPARAAATPELQPGVYVAVSIADTGVGMDARTRDRIFEPFFTTKAPGKGTGLGLATAYGIVRQSGGVIEVDSAPGRGTRMTIRLPFVASQAGVEQPCDTVANARDGHETILLVEDDARVRKLIRDVLTHKGYVVLEAARGNAALRFAERYGKPLHLAILDVVMPEMSGPEVGRNIVRLRPETRLLYISGYIDEAVLQHGILESGLPFLPKPFLPNVLAAKVREVLDAGMNVASA